MKGQVIIAGVEVPSESSSYAFDRFNQNELDRLMRQGRATWDDEVEFLRWAGLRTGDRVLDVGCGPGVISGLIADFVGPEGMVTGIDISDELLATGQILNRDRVTFIKGSVYELGTFRGQFDFAYVRLLFQHLSRPLDAMAQVLAILRPGGRACVLDSDEAVLGIHPQPPGLARLVSETQELQRQRGGDRFVGGRLAYYMKAAGFKEVEPRIFVMTPDSMGRKQFLDTTLSWRPLLYPNGARQQAQEEMERIYRHAEEFMVSGYSGSFVVRGCAPLPAEGANAQLRPTHTRGKNGELETCKNK